MGYKNSFAFLKASGTRFDFVFGDLTDTPVHHEDQATDLATSDPTWSFLRAIIGRGLELIKPESGRYLTHCNGKSVPACLEKYEEMIAAIDPAVNFRKRESFVSSFMEIWVFYELRYFK